MVKTRSALVVHARCSAREGSSYCAGGGMRENAWTDDGVALLRKLWAEGATAAAIGRRLGGRSRSAALGKVFRLRLNGEVAMPGAVEQSPSERGDPGRRRGRQPRRRVVAAPGSPPPGRFTLLELTNENCRWPSGRRGRFVFCGVAEADVAQGIPYCQRHMRRAYSSSVSFGKTERGDFTHSPKQLIGARA
jgi:GcrA cell cycle regulator